MRLMHPASKQVIEVLDGSAHRYIRNGWRKVEEAAPAVDAPVEAWQDYAVEQGFEPEEIEGQSAEEIRAALG